MQKLYIKCITLCTIYNFWFKVCIFFFWFSFIVYFNNHQVFAQEFDFEFAYPAVKITSDTPGFSPKTPTIEEVASHAPTRVDRVALYKVLGENEHVYKVQDERAKAAEYFAIWDKLQVPETVARLQAFVDYEAYRNVRVNVQLQFAAYAQYKEILDQIIAIINLSIRQQHVLEDLEMRCIVFDVIEDASRSKYWYNLENTSSVANRIYGIILRNNPTQVAEITHINEYIVVTLVLSQLHFNGELDLAFLNYYDLNNPLYEELLNIIPL